MLATTLLASTLLAGLFTVDGNGKIQEEARTVSDFRGVSVSGGIQLEVASSAEQRVVVVADANLLPLIETRVDQGLLVVRSQRSIKGSRDIVVKVRMPRTERLEASGGSRVRATLHAVPTLGLEGSGGAEFDVKGIDSDRLELQLSGGADARLEGKAKHADLDASGGVTVHGEQLQLGDASLQASGGVEAHLAVAQALRGDASGGVSVSVKGTPTVKVTTSGGASVQTVP